MPLIGTIATATAGSSTATLGATVNTTVAAGQTVIGAVSVESAAVSSPVLSVSDNRGNTYTVDVQCNSGSTVSTSIFSCRVTTQLINGDTITLTASDGTRSRWAVSIQAFDDILNPRLDKTALNAGNDSALTSGTTATTASADELLFAAFGFGANRTFTAGSGFTAAAKVESTAGSSNRAVNTEWKYDNVVGAKTATGTLSSSSTYAGTIATYFSQSSNVPPTANAGPDQTVTVNTSVTLDGTGSSDPDGTITGYSWTQTSGPAVTLSSSTVAKPTFTAPSSPTTLEFSLTVTDNNGATSTPDTCTVTVANPIGYVAEAVAGTQVTTGSSFVLNFSKTVSSSHSILMGIVVDAPPLADSSPVFTVTDSKSNTYVVDAVAFRTSTVAVALVSGFITTPVTTADTLTISCTTDRGRWAVSGSEFDNVIQSGLDKTVTNNAGSTTSLTTSTTATTVNQYEVIFAGFGFAYGDGETFSAGPHYTQAGTQQSTSAGSSERAVANAYRVFSTSFDHEATGTITDPSSYAAALATYHAIALTNQLPTANAGSPQTVDAFAETTLDGTGSSDEDGIITGYSWSQTAGPTVSLSSTTAAQPTFTAPGIDGGTSLTFSLNVTDNSGGTSASPSTVVITVNGADQFIAQSGSWVGIQAFSPQSGSWQ